MWKPLCLISQCIQRVHVDPYTRVLGRRYSHSQSLNRGDAARSEPRTLESSDATHGWLAAARGHCMHAFIDETVASVRACAWLCVATVRARDIVVARFGVCIVAARA